MSKKDEFKELYHASPEKLIDTIIQAETDEKKELIKEVLEYRKFIIQDKSSKTLVALTAIMALTAVASLTLVLLK